jgi:hypothetical protein
MMKSRSMYKSGLVANSSPSHICRGPAESAALGAISEKTAMDGKNVPSAVISEDRMDLDDPLIVRAADPSEMEVDPRNVDKSPIDIDEGSGEHQVEHR